jgi:hypothetical protein
MADSQISSFIWNLEANQLFTWKKNTLEDCPVYLCQSTQPTFPENLCSPCQQMEQDIPRLILLLYGMFAGLFQEVIEVREEMIIEKKEILVKGGKKKKIEVTHCYQVVEVSQIRKNITVAEQREITKKKNWIAGRIILTLPEIDWQNPPADDTVVLAKSQVKGHEREYRADRYAKSGLQGSKRGINPYDRPRQPMLFRTWKERQWEAIEVKAQAFE